MRDPPLARSILLVFVLALGGLASPFLVRSVGAYGEHVYEANPVLGPGDPYLSVYSDQTVAQSFVATATYSLLNVTLRLRNLGSPVNTVSITIRPDDPVNHTPDATNLASALVGTLSNAPPSNVSIVFNPAPALTAGEVYWIVAVNAASQSSSGYQWYHSNADSYSGGHADIYNATAGGWATLVMDMYFITYGRNFAANITAAMTANKAKASPGDLINFMIFFNNTGTSVAPLVWINDTVPAELTYVTDTATAGVLRSSTPFPSFTFSNVSNGIHSFFITVRVTMVVNPGTLLTNHIALSYTNVSGGLHVGQMAMASILVGLEAKQLYLAPNPGMTRLLTTTKPAGSTVSQVTVGRSNTVDFALSPALADSFVSTNVSANLFIDSQSRRTETLVLDLSVMDSNGTIAYFQLSAVTTDNAAGFQPFLFSFPSLNYTFPATHQIQLRVTNDASSSDEIILAYNATTVPSCLEVFTTSYVNITSMTFRDQNGPASYFSPMDSLTIEVNVSDPFGSGKIAGVWFNVTDPSGGLMSSYVTVADQVDPLSPSLWKVFRCVYGQKLTNGSYPVLVTAVEDNGVMDAASDTAIVRSPAFTFMKLASVLRARAGDRFSYFLWFNNSGTGPSGRVWINDSLPSQLSLQSFTSDPPGTYTGPYNWTWTSIEPGSHELIIDVVVDGSANQAAWIRNRVTLNFLDEKGHVWPSLSSLADVIINGPIVGTALASDPASEVHGNQTVVYTVTLTNTGDAAQTLWINDTMPAGFSFVTSTESAYGGTVAVAGTDLLFTFLNMPSGGVWSFTFTLRAGYALPRNAILLDTLGLNYTSMSGVLMPFEAVATSLLAMAPAIANATLDLLSSQATPGQSITCVITYANVGNERARRLWINLTMDPYLIFRDASLPAAYSYTTVWFYLTHVAVDSYRIYVNFSLSTSTPDRYFPGIAGTINYTDGYSNGMPTVVLPSDLVTVSSPSLALNVSPGNATVEAGTPLTYTVYAFNAGSGTASEVWLNLTLPVTFDFFADTSNATRTVVGNNYTWHWMDQPSGPHSFALYLVVKPTVADSTLTSLPFRLEYEDANHMARPPVTTLAMAKVVAPTIALTLKVDRTEVLAGKTFTYSLEVHNSGETTARWVSVLDGVDSRLDLLTYTANVPVTGNRSAGWTWNLTDVAPGESEWINVTVRVADGLAARTEIMDVFEAQFSNSLGGPSIGYVRSGPATITVGVDMLPLIYIGLAGAIAAPVLGLVVARRQRVDVEEVFLVYRDGVLISHLSRTLLPDKDEDVLSGMLTAVQEFVRDAFRYGEHRELHQMDFGDYRILIERGKLAYLAVVYSGKNSASVRKRVRSVLDRIETSYASVLDKWDGDMEKVVGVRDILRDHLLKSNGHSRNHSIAD